MHNIVIISSFYTISLFSASSHRLVLSPFLSYLITKTVSVRESEDNRLHCTICTIWTMQQDCLIFTNLNSFYKQVLFFIERQKKHSKSLIEGSGVRKTFRLSCHTPRIQFNVLSRTSKKKGERNKSIVSTSGK